MTQSDWQLERQQLTSQLKQQEAELELLREEIARLRAANQGSLLAKAKRLLKGSKSAASVGSDDRQLLKDSPLFDADWYLKTYKDVASHPKWASDPEGHYLSFAISQLRRPGPGFDTEWYLSYYPDVKAARVNPLVHYILHGEQEDRLPLKPEGGAVSHIGVGRADYLNRKMWAGYANVAVPGLERISEIGGKRSRAKALWYMARWYFNHGDFEKASELLESIVEIQEGLSRRTLVALNKCYTHMRDFESAAELFDAPEATSVAGKTLPYLQANAAMALQSEQSTAERLRAINTLFWNQGLAGIAVSQVAGDSESFTIEHIQADHVPEPVVQAAVELPLISIIIPAYNAESTIHIALQSLLAQSWKNLEIIVVDDCSRDATAARVEQFCEQDSRVKLLRHEVNKGAYPARNFGMQRAAGAFVTVHDSDDWSHPQKLEKQAMVLLNDDTKVASVSNWVRVKPDMRFVGSWYMDENFLEKNHSSTLFRKSAVDQLGGWDNVNVAGDSEYIWRVEHAFGSDAIVTVLPDAPLSFALELDDSLTRNSATHVRTIHYGLRRLYREAARWWHNDVVSKGLLPKREDAEFAFPIPLGNKRGSATQFDVLFVADFSTENTHIGAVVERLEQLAKEHQKHVVLFHWPDFNKWEGAPIAAEVFSICHQQGIAFCHHGQRLTAHKLVFFNPALWENKLDVVPCIEGVKEVEVIKVSESDVSDGLGDRIKGYFECEGKDV